MNLSYDFSPSISSIVIYKYFRIEPGPQFSVKKSLNLTELGHTGGLFLASTDAKCFLSNTCV